MTESKKQLKERINNLKVQLERSTRYANETAASLHDERVQRQAAENRVAELEAQLEKEREPNWDALMEGI